MHGGGWGEISGLREMLAFSGQERNRSSEAFYPGFLSVGVIRQSRRTPA